MEEGKSLGWVFFAALMLIFAGVLRGFDALWAFRYDGEVPDGLEDAVFGTSLTTYGWIWLAIAAVLVLSGVALFSGSQLGRWVGIGAAALGGITAITWMPYYPVWSLVYIVISTLVFYALAVHGGREVLE